MFGYTSYSSSHLLPKSPTKIATAAPGHVADSPAGDKSSGQYDPLSTARPRLIKQLKAGVEEKLDLLIKSQDTWVTFPCTCN